VPEHWSAGAVKRHYSIQLGKMLQGQRGGPLDEEVPYLKAQHVQWFSVRTTDLPRMWASPMDRTLYGVSSGDLLVCEGGEGGRSGVVRGIDDGCIIQNALHRVRPTGQNSNEYLQYVMSTVSALGWFDAINSKATIAHFTREKFGALGMPIPSGTEQAAIVSFLDHMDRRIRRYIAAKKKLVALLNEQKQAIINRAVTRGLDPNVRLKPSGVEWLGDVPEHWEVKRLKQVITRVEQGWSPQCDAQPATEDEWGVLKVGCVNKDYFDATQNKKLPVTLQPVPALEVENEDILVSRANTRELLGLAALAVEPRRKLMLCDKLFRFRALPQRALPQFLVHAIRGKTSRAQIESSTNLYLALPPLYEQRAIVSVIAQEVRSIQALASQTEREIILIREYRTRLIADVVTGKLDVREAAARLPEEVEEPELEDVGEQSPEGEEEEVDQEAALEEVMA
jgi:type I restriction enzyme S subunit